MALQPPPINDVESSFTFKEWLNKLYTYVGGVTGGVPWATVDKTGSSLADLATRQHGQLQAVSGSTDGYHLSSTDYSRLSMLKGTIEYSVPITGFSSTIANTTSLFIIKPAGTLATGTITMPASPFDTQIVGIASTQIVTALTHSPNTGQTLNGALTTIAANGHAAWVYRSADTSWYRIE
jgi:hypothetical protein